jgi:hypothetical protein
MVTKLPSGKRLQIDKANATMVGILAAAAFVTVFSLIACKALLGQRSYESRVIAKKKTALAQLKANNTAATQLVNSYKSFVSSPDNIIGGSPTGTGDRDGDNAKIILDALPSKYDFPALATSVEKVLTDKSYKIDSISGTDDELNQSQQNAASQPVEIPFEVTVTGNFDTAQGILDVFQKSIRPIQLVKIEFSGADNTLQVHVTAKSYYQPQKTLTITKQVVK